MQKIIRKNYRLDQGTIECLSDIQKRFHISESEAVRLAIKEFFHTEFGMRLIPAANLQRMIEERKLNPSSIVLVDLFDLREDSEAIHFSPSLSERFAESFVERFGELTEDDELPF